MNQGNRSGAMRGQAKATGLQAGAVDVRVYLPEGRMALLELKRAKGVVSPAQKSWHSLLASLGHVVHVVRGGTPAEMWDRVREALGLTVQRESEGGSHG